MFVRARTGIYGTFYLREFRGEVLGRKLVGWTGFGQSLQRRRLLRSPEERFIADRHG